MTVDTERLTLIPLTQDQLRLVLPDLDALERQLEGEIDPRIVDEAVIRAVRMKIDRMETIERHLHPWYTYWLIALREANLGVGLMGYKGEPCIQGKYDHIGEVEIGYGIAPDHRRQGYTTEAAHGLITWAFQDPECVAVIAADVLKTNIPSQRVLEKVGMMLYRETEETQFWRIDKVY